MFFPRKAKLRKEKMPAASAAGIFSKCTRTTTYGRASGTDFLVELLLFIIFIVEVFISFVVEPATNVRKYWNARKVFYEKSTTKHRFVFFNIKNTSSSGNFHPIFPAREYVFREKILNFAEEKQRTLRVLYLHCQQNKEQNKKP